MCSLAPANRMLGMDETEQGEGSDGCEMGEKFVWRFGLL